MDTHTEELLIGYVLDVLDPDERQTVETHISKNPALRSEIYLWQQQVHRLALQAPLVPPLPVTKQQLLARVRGSSRPALTARPAQRRASLAWVLALALVVALGGWNIGLRNENAQLRANNIVLARNLDDERFLRGRMTERVTDADLAMELLVSQNTTSRTLAPTTAAPRASGTMYMQPGKTTAVLIVDGLEPLPANRTYQFWLASANGVPVPSDTFNVSAAGHAQVVIKVHTQVNDFKQVMITIEPASGSSKPSNGTTVLEGSL